jgi:hypothetical protein
MERREAVKLLALAPLALSLKPSKPEPFELRCRDCDALVGTVSWPYRVEQEGRSYCGAHAGQPSGYGLITEYHIGIYPDGWGEARRVSRMSIMPV